MTEQRNLLRDMTDRFLATLQSDTKAPLPFDHHAWSRINEQALPNLLIDEDKGGFGGDWLDAYTVFYNLGFRITSFPVGESILAKALLPEDKQIDTTRPMTFGKSQIATLTHKLSDTLTQFTGKIISVPWGDCCDYVLTEISTDTENFLLALETRHATKAVTHRTISGEPIVEFSFEACPIMCTTHYPEHFPSLVHLGAALRCAQMAGAMQGILEMSIEFVSDRRQFGRALSKFQSIQHQLAILAEETLASSSAAIGAFTALDQGTAEFEVASAKLRANRAVPKVTSIAHQVHGAIGFTKEHNLHHFTQRLLSWRSSFGNDQFWASRIEKQIRHEGHSNLWEFITARSDFAQCDMSLRENI